MKKVCSKCVRIISLVVVLFVLFLANINCLYAQKQYKININKPEKTILSNHLNLGGENPDGEKISVNSYFIEKNDKPFFPVIGEFHYSRFPESFWEESILKMKSGGINVIATYVFWNIHERKEGYFDWGGNLNLRRFAELVKKHNMCLIVRLGPFCHGEIRNGGLPDWLYGQTFEVRSNAPEYLKYVDTLYREIAKQISGLLYKDGGPIIGVQLENEYQHSAAPWEYSYPGSKKEYTVANFDAATSHEQITVTDGKNTKFEYGKQHMENLKQIALSNGIDVPIYTATGWGNATIVERGSLPVTAGYAYPFWGDASPSAFYLFKDICKFPDYSPVSYDTDLYPSIAAEIGPGIQVKYSRRPIVEYESVKPMMVRIVGSSSNGIGYYMYHGGSTPQFDGKFYNEEVNGLPRVNYDFQAPIGQYGQTRKHYKQLRTLHIFLSEYGERLAPMKVVLPETNGAITPTDTETLRYAVRSYGDSGFLFMVNFQDHVEIKSIDSVNVTVETGNEAIKFPTKGTFDLPEAACAILPFNLELGKTLIKSATMQPLTVLHQHDGDYYVFSSIKGIKPEINFPIETKLSELENASVIENGSIKSVEGADNKPFSFVANGEKFIGIPENMSLNAMKIDERLVISEALILDDLDGVQLISQEQENDVHIFPAREIDTEGFNENLKRTSPLLIGFSSYKLAFNEIKPDVSFNKISEKKYALTLNSDISKLNDLFVNINYIGDRG
ncbi:MAG: beta-galactosidase, partial [Draconibacterium sp.]